jgi:hypothetical protein
LTIAFRMAWIRIIRASLTLLVDERSASVPSANRTSRTFRSASLTWPIGPTRQLPVYPGSSRAGQLL